MTTLPVQRIKVLITVKTYPAPSKKYDELVCTAGVTENGDFIRLYPINFRELPNGYQYKKYQWIEVDVVRHKNDKRKESYRPIPDTMKIIGMPIPSKGNWAERAKYVLKKKAKSLEELADMNEQDRTSLGIIRPKTISDMVVGPADSAEWRPSVLAEMKQMRLFEDRKKTLVPPRKLPFKFQYVFRCDDERCKGHRIMNEDWELGALYWKLVDDGNLQETVVRKVRQKFFDEICGAGNDTFFYVGTVSNHPKTWLVLGTFYPKKTAPSLFDGN